MMMLQIRRKNQQNKLGYRWQPLSLSAFTLIELLIVATLILILVAVSTPRFRSTFSDLELRNVSYDIGKMIKYAQHRAVLEERRYKVIFDFENRSYRLLVENEDNKFSVEDEPLSSWKKVTGRFGENFYLPDGVEFKGEKDEVTFLPNGRCDKSSIYVINRKNKVIEIRTTGRAGYIEISSVNKEE